MGVLGNPGSVVLEVAALLVLCGNGNQNELADGKTRIKSFKSVSIKHVLPEEGAR